MIASLNVIQSVKVNQSLQEYSQTFITFKVNFELNDLTEDDRRLYLEKVIPQMNELVDQEKIELFYSEENHSFTIKDKEWNEYLID